MRDARRKPSPLAEAAKSVPDAKVRRWLEWLASGDEQKPTRKAKPARAGQK